MATYVEGHQIFMTRGDTPTFNVNLFIGETTTQYNPAAGDAVYFRLAQEPLMEQILEKALDDGKWTMDVEDTASLDPGKYLYSLELVTAGGFHDTFVKPDREDGVFEIGAEVEHHE